MLMYHQLENPQIYLKNGIEELDLSEMGDYRCSQCSRHVVSVTHISKQSCMLCISSGLLGTEDREDFIFEKSGSVIPSGPTSTRCWRWASDTQLGLSFRTFSKRGFPQDGVITLRSPPQLLIQAGWIQNSKEPVLL